jgi:hypothetical protein
MKKVFLKASVFTIFKRFGRLDPPKV